jgi:ribosomal protein L11 methyltransferase
VANISARGVCDRAPFILAALKPEGLFVASGLLQSQQPEVDDTLVPLGFSLIRSWLREDWVSLLYQAPASRAEG